MEIQGRRELREPLVRLGQTAQRDLPGQLASMETARTRSRSPMDSSGLKPHGWHLSLALTALQDLPELTVLQDLPDLRDQKAQLELRDLRVRRDLRGLRAWQGLMVQTENRRTKWPWQTASWEMRQPGWPLLSVLRGQKDRKDLTDQPALD